MSFTFQESFGQIFLKKRALIGCLRLQCTWCGAHASLMGSDDTPHGHGTASASAHAHGHSHGEASTGATPLITPTGESKDGVVYFTAPDGRTLHSHDGLKPHSHDPIPNAGSFQNRRKRKYNRNYTERAFTIGIGGPVGTGKTALMLSLCKHLRDAYAVAAITNDIFTREDGEYLIKHNALDDKDKIRAVETGGCPHAAIREDISCNLTEAESLTEDHSPDFILLESGGDNLAANFSRELADFIVYVIDVCGGDKIPRKGGPGVTQADLLVINKVELADAVGASLEVMARDAKAQRESGPFVMANVKKNDGVPEIAEHILSAWRDATGGKKKKYNINWGRGE